jgi:hypothetical protein
LLARLILGKVENLLDVGVPVWFGTRIFSHLILNSPENLNTYIWWPKLYAPAYFVEALVIKKEV